MLIYLIGFSGAGKTTTARQIATKLKYNFIDTDAFIEEKVNKSVSQIFNSAGEAKFRELEKEAITEISNLKDTVVATGGGLSCFNNNMELMKKTGLTVYLKVNTGILFQRLVKEKKTRPLIKTFTDVEVMEFITYNLQLREPFYKQCQIKFNADDMSAKSMETLLAEIRTMLTQRL